MDWCQRCQPCQEIKRESTWKRSKYWPHSFWPPVAQIFGHLCSNATAGTPLSSWKSHAEETYILTVRESGFDGHWTVCPGHGSHPGCHLLWTHRWEVCLLLDPKKNIEFSFWLVKYIELFNMKSWSNPVLPPHLVSSNFNLIKCSLCLDVGGQSAISFFFKTSISCSRIFNSPAKERGWRWGDLWEGCMNNFCLFDANWNENMCNPLIVKHLCSHVPEKGEKGWKNALCAVWS